MRRINIKKTNKIKILAIFSKRKRDYFWMIGVDGNVIGY